MVSSACTVELRDRLLAHAGRAATVGDLFATASEHLRGLVPFDAAVWLACDPATGLPTAPTRAHDMPRIGIDGCRRVWELEYTVEDVNRFGALARADRPAAGLRDATRDLPTRSPRYRELVEPHGFEDELRAVLRAGGRPWGLVALYRAAGEPAFAAPEAAQVAELSAPLAAAVRERVRPAVAPGPPAGRRGPGLLVFAADGELVSVNDDARAWLDELTGEDVGTDVFAVPLPLAVISTLMRARAIAEERERGSARVRIRSRATGRWVACQASCLRDAVGAPATTALVIEPPEASELATLFAEAYALSPRELDVTACVARGLGTREIAAELCLSGHTVRDHLKSIFEKVEVSSRGELVARLFTEHYAPLHLAAEAGG